MKATGMKLKSLFGEESVAVWESPSHAAAAFKDGDALRLDIVRQDLSSGMTWDELRSVKNELGFSDFDAVEYYPKEADVINTGNMRHLYLFNERLPNIKRRTHA